jgi:hypothetical protein
MATVQNPITGRSKGKFANAIFSKWKGRNTLRSKPLEVANPQSPAQVQQRDSFAASMAFARAIAAIVYVGFAQFKDTISEFNAFMKYAYEGWVDKTGPAPAFAFDWPNLIVSKGPIASVAISSITSADASANIVVNYPSTILGSGQSLSDLAYVVAYNETQDMVGYVAGTNDRQDGSTTVTMSSPNSAGDVLYCYLFFKSIDSLDVSDSIYDGGTTT